MKKTPSARAQSLYSLAKSLEAKMRDMAASISSQTGVSMDEATKETDLSIGRLSDWAAYCDKIKGGNVVSLCSVFHYNITLTLGLFQLFQLLFGIFLFNMLVSLFCSLCRGQALGCLYLMLWELWGLFSRTATPFSPW